MMEVMGLQHMLQAKERVDHCCDKGDRLRR